MTTPSDEMSRDQRADRKGLVLDLVLAGAVLLLGEFQLFFGGGGPNEIGPGVVGGLIVALQSLPLIWRRRSPFIVLVIVTFASSIPPLIGHLGDNQFSLLAVTTAVYTVAAYARVRAAIAGVLIAISGGLVHQLPQMEDFDPLFLAFAWVPMGAAAFIGSQVQLGRRRLQFAEHEAQLSVWENEARSRRAISEERARIARELHDLVAHNMTSMALQAGAARLYFDSNPEQAREVLSAIESGSRKALAEMRRLLGVLRTEDDESLALAPQPSLAQVEDLIKSSKAAGLEVDLSIEGDPKVVSPGLDLTAYRILQEALTNALKHGARDHPTSIVVRYLPDHLELSIRNQLLVHEPIADHIGGGHGL